MGAESETRASGSVIGGSVRGECAVWFLNTVQKYNVLYTASVITKSTINAITSVITTTPKERKDLHT